MRAMSETETAAAASGATRPAVLDRGADPASFGEQSRSQRLAVVRIFSLALIIAGALSGGVFLCCALWPEALDPPSSRILLLLIALFALSLAAAGVVSVRLCRRERLRAATFSVALALIVVATSDLVLIAGVQAIAIMIYCVAIGFAALGLDSKEWPWLIAGVGLAALTGSILQYVPVVEQAQLPRAFLAMLTVIATTWGLVFPMGLFWMFSRSLTDSQAQAWELAQSLARANHLKTEFLNTMSHELRSPLHVIIGNTQILLEGSEGTWSTEQVRLLERVNTYAVELLRLVQSTLDLSRIETGRMPMHVERFSLHGVVEEVKEATAAVPRPHALDLRWQVAGDVPDLVTDRLKLKEVVQNLVTNAVKFTPAGHVQTRATSDGDHVLIEVSDTGVGIPPEDLSLIFESFGQSLGGKNGQLGGVGLGLYIVKRLVELLGGTIDVTSTPGDGSIFAVRLPVCYAGAGPDLAPVADRGSGDRETVQGALRRHSSHVLRPGLLPD
jgi:signal transduction histidine kinase